MWGAPSLCVLVCWSRCTCVRRMMMMMMMVFVHVRCVLMAASVRPIGPTFVVDQSHGPGVLRAFEAEPGSRSSDGSLRSLCWWMWVIKVRRWRAGFTEWPPMCNSQELLLLQCTRWEIIHIINSHDISYKSWSEDIKWVPIQLDGVIFKSKKISVIFETFYQKNKVFKCRHDTNIHSSIDRSLL